MADDVPPTQRREAAPRIDRQLQRWRVFIDDLSRRRVTRSVVAYALGAWLAIQIADVVFPLFDVPSWIFKAMACGLALGLPVIVTLTWLFQITPHGVIFDRAGPSRGRETWQDLAVVMLTICAVGVFVALLVGARGPEFVPRVRLHVTAVDAVAAVDGVDAVMPPGGPSATEIETELRVALERDGVLSPIPNTGVRGVGEYTLWVSVEPAAGTARLRALLLDVRGGSAYPYVDDFEIEVVHGPDAMELLGAKAAEHISRRIGEVLAPRTALVEAVGGTRS